MMVTTMEMSAMPKMAQSAAKYAEHQHGEGEGGDDEQVSPRALEPLLVAARGWLVAVAAVVDQMQPGPAGSLLGLKRNGREEDVTPLLERQRYIPSYNIPYFKDIFAISGYGRAGFNYTTDPRAQIFRRDHGKVYDIDSMCKLMNSNNYKRDPLSKGNPCNQISARCDLPDASLPHQQSNGPYAFGGIDSKNVDHSHVNAQRVRAISGMPYEHVPAFVFDEQWSGVAHQGMPHMFKFNWTTMAPAP
ncbi:hypothetical protein PTSG_02634 [Salpingoeca rosetta]|uniref:Phospholipase B-like n=1 Tax=Salpingoeca rosetta (strain ATCC 50818 / BSB-021) TaxID=946362 RepID=F2U2V5_SALR5|nr:uncharacterized protein PTSG_02634 [Salpingoeca rosetta]EGD81949.1 hypothetical protein PTSG_02634 [Salpingoeca rosetta]|eukprot:XP_004996132.1 hypothetical protein PTSG_02634 [Salpingoeca rosetta]